MSTPPPTSASSTRNAPLDGLRGLGTIFVLVGHLGILAWWWPPLAGVLAVSMFFTLSGYLIATGLLRQIDRTGSVGWRRFYAGRARRLLPAATVTIAVVTVAWWIADRDLPTSEVVASLTYWRNWQLIAQSGSYAEVFTEASPFQHFWSLAIEEQFYLLMPALLVGLMALVRRRLGLAAVVVGVGTLVSFWFGAHFEAVDRSRAYYGTEVRAGEFLMGVLLALGLASPVFKARVERLAATRFSTWGTTVLAAISILLWWRVGFSTRGLFPYLVPLNALITALLIAYFVSPNPRGFGTWVFSLRPMTELGRRSYSVYLLHWPIYLLLDRVGPAQLGESVLKVGLAITAGLVLFALVEDPVQRATTWRTGRRLALGLAVTSVVAVGAVMVASANREAPFIDVDAIDRSREDFFADLPPIETTTPPDAPPPSTDATGGTIPPDTTPLIDTSVPDGPAPIDVQRVLLVGDSNGWTSSFWLRENPDQLPWDFRFWSGTGCGTTVDTLTRGRNEPDDILCPGWLDDLGQAVDAYQPDVVLVVSLAGDLAEHDLGDGQWRTIGDPVYDAFLEERMDSFVDLVGATGARIGWFTQTDYAVIDRATGQLGRGANWALNDPAAVAQMNGMIHDLAERDERVLTVPFREWAETWPNGQMDRDFRPDGAHLDGAREDVGRWIMSQVEALASGRPGTVN